MNRPFEDWHPPEDPDLHGSGPLDFGATLAALVGLNGCRVSVTARTTGTPPLVVRGTLAGASELLEALTKDEALYFALGDSGFLLDRSEFQGAEPTEVGGGVVIRLAGGLILTIEPD